MATPHHLSKKRGALKSTPNSFFFFFLFFFKAPNFGNLSQRRPYWGCQGLSFVLDLSDKICTLVLHGLALYCYLFVYLCSLRCCMICCLYCLLKAFPNCHSVCHPNNMYAPFSTTCGGSNSYSPTHSLKSLDHFLLTVKDKPCHLDQRNVHYITSWEV